MARGQCANRFDKTHTRKLRSSGLGISKCTSTPPTSGGSALPMASGSVIQILQRVVPGEQLRSNNAPTTASTTLMAV